MLVLFNDFLSASVPQIGSVGFAKQYYLLYFRVKLYSSYKLPVYCMADAIMTLLGLLIHSVHSHSLSISLHFVWPCKTNLLFSSWSPMATTLASVSSSFINLVSTNSSPKALVCLFIPTANSSWLPHISSFCSNFSTIKKTNHNVVCGL